MRSLALSLLALGALGCQPGAAPRALPADPLAGALYVEAGPLAGAAVEALALWSDATAGRVALRPVIVEGEPPGEGWFLRGAELGGWWAEWTGAELRIDYRTVSRVPDPEAWATVVIAHELGHAFGLPHAPGTLMREQGNPGDLATEIDPATRAAFCERWGCPSARKDAP